jgi:hypothetical protein
MSYVMAALAIVLASETVFHLPFDRVLSTSVSTAKKSAAVIQSPRISDHWKARAVSRYAAVMLASTFALALMCGAVVGIVAAVALAGRLFEQDLFGFFMSWPGLGTAAAASMVYVVLRRRLV